MVSHSERQDPSNSNQPSDETTKRKAAAEAWAWKGWNLITLGESEEAKKCYDKAAALDPTNVYAWGGKYWTSFLSGTIDQFAESIKKLSDENPSEITYLPATYFMALALFESGKLEESLDGIDRCIQLNPTSDQSYLLWLNKGYVYFLLEKYDDAMICTQTASQINPIPGYDQVLKGAIFDITGKHQEAIECYSKFIERKAASQWYDKLWVAYTWTLKGNAFSNMKRNDEAIDCYDKAFKIIPDYPAVILVCKSIALLNDEWSKRANSVPELDIEIVITILDKCLVNAPTNAYLWTLKGDILSNLGRYDEAIQCYDEALKIKPNYRIAEHARKIMVSINHEGDDKSSTMM